MILTVLSLKRILYRSFLKITPTQFALVPNLTKELIDKFLDTVEIDEWFIPFCKKAKEAGMPVVVLSDGLDYFINKILERHKIDFINVITNHAYFNEYNKFIIGE